MPTVRRRRPMCRPRARGWSPLSAAGRRRPIQSGFTLPELLIVLSIAGVLAVVAVPARAWVEAASLRRSTDLARSHLTRARALAVARRQVLRVRVGEEGRLLLLDPQDSLMAVTHVQGDGLLRLDSLRLRPATLRFNARGQASPGSLYLYRGRRGARLISNFLGRLRRVPITVPDP